MDNLNKVLGEVAPAIAEAIEGPLGAAAVQILADAFGARQPHLDAIAAAAADLHPNILQTVAANAETTFQQAIAQAAPAQPAGSPPPVAGLTNTHGGTTISPWMTVGLVIMNVVGGCLVHHGYVTSDQIVQYGGAVTTVLSGSVMLLQNLIANVNTVALPSS